MMFSKIFREIRKHGPLFPREFPRHEIHSAEGFRKIMERECARTERTGVIFSLVVFENDSGEDDVASSLQGISDVIRSRVRIGDEVGWFDGKSLAALLLGTPANGAWKFAGKVCKAIVPDMPLSICKVYTYPPTRNSNGGNRSLAEQLDMPLPGVIPATGADASSMRQDGCKPTEGIESVLARQIPRWKRVIDIIGALAGLILLSPLFLLLAIFIKAVSPGTVFFKQERVGYMGKTFTFWKFRTMQVHNDATIHQRYLSQLIHGDDAMIKLDDGKDSRIIIFGKILRQTYLDELPQLINVLFGDMSLVGPRPCLPYEARDYLLWHTRRFDTVPGMTGLWQVSGKNRTTFKEMIRLDITYIKKMSLWLDVKILLKTIAAIFIEIAEKLANRMNITATAAVAPKGDNT